MSSIILNEYCDKRLAQWLIDNINNINYRHSSDPAYDPKKTIKKYCEQVVRSNNGYIKRIYKQNESGRGRYFLKDGQVGYQNMMREFRSLLCHKDYYDLDIKNCQPSILEQYCKKNEIECELLTFYNKNRDEIYNSVKSKMSKGDFKIHINSILFGSKNYKELYDIVDTKIFNVKSFCEELQNIMVCVCELENEIIEYVETKNKHNIKGSVVSLLCQDIESFVVKTAMTYLKNKNYEICSYCFDGLLIRNTTELSQTIINNLNKYIYVNTGYKLEFVVKEFEEVKYNDGRTIIVNDDDLKDEAEQVLVSNETEAVDYVIKCIGNNLVYSNGRYFIKKFKNANIYEEDKSIGNDTTKKYVLAYITTLNIYLVTYTNEKESIKQLSKRTKGATDILKLFIAKFNSDEEFIKKLWYSNIYKLCFINGYYDFKTMTFKEYDDDTYTTIYVEKNYKSDVNDKYIKKVYDMILKPIFPDEQQLKYFLNWYSRAIAGHFEDKTWVVGIGGRNSGKSVITDLFKHTFNEYIDTFNAEELCVCKNMGDIAKRLAWCVGFEYKRIIFSNEVKTENDNMKNKLDGVVIKSITGGDEKTARKLYSNEVKFKLQSKMCLFMNEIIDITPYDATETLNIIEFCNTFKSEITEDDVKFNNESEKCKRLLANPDIKFELLNQDIQHAFIHILISHYTKDKIKQPEIIEDNKLFYCPEEIKKGCLLNELFEFTHNPKDKITLAEYNNILTKNNINKSSAKIELQKNCVSDCKIQSTRYKRGIKIKYDFP
jgi:hypothetical protein